MTRTFPGAYVEPVGAFKIERNTLAPAKGRLAAPRRGKTAPIIQETGFAPDSPLEGDGFEPSVPFVDWGVSGFSRLTDRCAARLNMRILDGHQANVSGHDWAHA